MNELYLAEGEEQFLRLLKVSKKKLKTSQILQKSDSLLLKSKVHSQRSNILELPQKMMTQRFNDHFQLLKRQINQTQQKCQKFGGHQFVKEQLDKNQITKEDYVNYCIQRISKNFELPKISTRSQSLKELNSKPKKLDLKKNLMKHNKWFINPEKRFDQVTGQKRINWKEEQCVANLLSSKGNLSYKKYLNEFIDSCKNKLHRYPLACKLEKIN